jgi:hypothetical protein
MVIAVSCEAVDEETGDACTRKVYEIHKYKLCPHHRQLLQRGERLELLNGKSIRKLSAQSPSRAPPSRSPPSLAPPSLAPPSLAPPIRRRPPPSRTQTTSTTRPNPLPPVKSAKNATAKNATAKNATAKNTTTRNAKNAKDNVQRPMTKSEQRALRAANEVMEALAHAADTVVQVELLRDMYCDRTTDHRPINTILRKINNLVSDNFGAGASRQDTLEGLAARYLTTEQAPDRKAIQNMLNDIDALREEALQHLHHICQVPSDVERVYTSSSANLPDDIALWIEQHKQATPKLLIACTRSSPPPMGFVTPGQQPHRVVHTSKSCAVLRPISTSAPASTKRTQEDPVFSAAAAINQPDHGALTAEEQRVEKAFVSSETGLWSWIKWVASWLVRGAKYVGQKLMELFQMLWRVAQRALQYVAESPVGQAIAKFSPMLAGVLALFTALWVVRGMHQLDLFMGTDKRKVLQKILQYVLMGAVTFSDLPVFLKTYLTYTILLERTLNGGVAGILSSVRSYIPRFLGGQEGSLAQGVGGVVDWLNTAGVFTAAPGIPGAEAIAVGEGSWSLDQLLESLKGYQLGGFGEYIGQQLMLLADEKMLFLRVFCGGFLYALWSNPQTLITLLTTIAPLLISFVPGGSTAMTGIGLLGKVVGAASGLTGAQVGDLGASTLAATTGGGSQWGAAMGGVVGGVKSWLGFGSKAVS